MNVYCNFHLRRNIYIHTYIHTKKKIYRIQHKHVHEYSHFIIGLNASPISCKNGPGYVTSILLPTVQTFLRLETKVFLS